jgi:hypothetical protein
MNEVHELEIIDESILDDEVKCQFRHQRTTCGPVAYRVHSCGGSVNVCTNAVEDPEYGIRICIERRDVRCAECRRPARDCWSVHPI